MVDDAAGAELAQQRAAIEARLNAGEWLRVADLALLFGVHHATFHRWVKRDRLVRFRQSPAGGRAPLSCHPEDVKKLLAAHRAAQGGEAAPAG